MSLNAHSFLLMGSVSKIIPARLAFSAKLGHETFLFLNRIVKWQNE
ncbi:hypothetical protein KIS4809_0939 [Bacillus sp. ZZV12-4809]|nr:hypothetical protein KIS4809_0939 [Bacillus sp. ZZV12-4809]